MAAVIELCVVTVIHTRSPDYLRWQLRSLERQTVPVHVVVVHTSMDRRLQEQTASVCRLMSRHTLLLRPSQDLRLAWSLNVGIQHVPETCPFAACVNVDFVFSDNFCREALDKLKERDPCFVQCEPASLGRGFPVQFLLENWGAYAPQLQLHCHGRTWPGAFQAAPREWWHKVHGYDERYTLAGMDDDLQFRAHMDGLYKYWIPFEHAQALHQWHEPSTARYDDGDQRLIEETGRQVVANRDGWGEWGT